MAIEIERKFLVRDDSWRAQVSRSAVYRQGYLSREGGVSVRVRLADQRAWLNLKSATLDISRAEFEYDIPLDDATQLLNLCTGAVIDKTRYFVEQDDGHTWEIDVFAGANAGLVVAEIELAQADERFDRPDWLGTEVSADARYYNVCLAEHPFTLWGVTRDPDAL